MKTIYLLFALLVLFHITGKAQMKLHSMANHAIQLEINEDSQTQEIVFNVNDEGSDLSIIARSKIRSGNMKLEIYDTFGSLQKQISLKGNDINTDFEEILTRDNKITLSDSETIMGQTRMQVRDSHKGTWKVKIIPDKAKGEVDVRVSKSVIFENKYEIDL